ncbi:MAG: hypothetical protein H7222_04550 [Methylotenera sp.]|nr:hypothetical protein [Oligoflexia bacterium]
MRQTRVSAPSNIALIKYMGKVDPALNLPANGSLSMTLNQLCTYVEITETATATRWLAEAPAELPSGTFSGAVRVPKLTEAGILKVIRHHERVLAAVFELFPVHGLSLAPITPVEIRTANTFPADSGIASSASSFAALTFGTALHSALDPKAFTKVWEENLEFRRSFAKVSRQGSGSSCRSFEGPWVLWEKGAAAGLITPMPEMVDFVVLIATGPKPVTSTQAHHLVQTSPLWEGRTERVAERLKTVEAALGEGDIITLSRVAWAEMWEMHSLFHTCSDPFTYWEPGTLKVIKWLAPYIQEGGAEGSELTPPIVTMDAGANVHILVAAAEATKWQTILNKAFPEFEILQDTQGTGAKVLPALTKPVGTS